MKTGFGICEFTPYGRKISLLGQMHERITEEIHDGIFVTAMLVESENARTLWIAADALGMTAEASHECYLAAKEIIPDLKEEEFVTSATHIHTGLSFEAYNSLTATDTEPEGVIKSEECRKLLADAVKSAVIKAVENLEESRMEIAVSRIQTGVCRRMEYKDGKTIMYGSTARDDFLKSEGRDGGPMQLIYVYGENNNLKGIVANLPCTAQCDEQASYVTSDYWGVVRAEVTEKLGEDVIILPLCRAAGDLTPHHYIDRFPSKPDDTKSGGRKSAEELGERIAREIVHCKDETVREYSGSVNHAQGMKEITLPCHTITKEEYQWAKDFIEKYNSDETYKGDGSEFCTGNRRFNHLNSHYKIRKYENNNCEEIKTRIYATVIGDIVFITNPFELFIEYGDRIRMALKDNIVYDVQLCYERLGYLPTERASKGGSYSTFTFNGACTPNAGEILVKESIDLVKSIAEY